MSELSGGKNQNCFLHILFMIVRVTNAYDTDSCMLTAIPSSLFFLLTGYGDSIHPAKTLFHRMFVTLRDTVSAVKRNITALL